MSELSAQTPAHISRPPAVKASDYERMQIAAQARRKGHTWDEVAALAGYGDRSAAHNGVKRLMEITRDLAYHEAELYRAESLDRLEAVLKAAWPFMETGSEKHMAIVLRTIRQIGELRGENAPVRVEIGESDVDRLLRESLAELNRRSAEASRQAD